MTLPNLLVIGAQKCGTSWLYFALSRSKRFWGSNPKELNFWNRPVRDIDACEKFFQSTPANVNFVFEATPHYFRPRKRGINVARNIREGLGDIPLILLLRDPVERYLSAYTHHMMQGRLPNVPVLEKVTLKYGIRDLGRYATALRPFDRLFSNVHIYLYDDLVADPSAFVNRIFQDFGLEYDLRPWRLRFRANDKTVKQRQMGLKQLPVLSDELRADLRAFYREEVDRIEARIGRDLSTWR